MKTFPEPGAIRTFAGVLTLLLAACVNTPSGYRPAPIFDNASLLDADPATLRFAAQSNVEPKAYTLEWSVTRDRDGTTLTKGDADLERLAAGKTVGFDLPPARDGQTWSVWALGKPGRKRFLELQRTVRAAKARDEKLAFSIQWRGTPAEPSATLPDVVYMTYALRLADDGSWFTLMDNLAVIPDEPGAK